MNRVKKTPMYESTTSPNDMKTYDFVDFTTPQTNCLTYQTPSQTTKQSQLIRKIQSLYKSQLLNIEELKQEENHVEETNETKEQLNYDQKIILSDIGNNGQPFSKIMRLDTYQTLGMGQDFEDEILALTGRSSCDSTGPLSNAFKIRKSKTFIGQQIQNFGQNYLPSYHSKPSYLTSCDQNYSGLSKQYYPTAGYFMSNSDFTSDDLIELMPNPYKNNLQMLKQRVKSKNQRIL